MNMEPSSSPRDYDTGYDSEDEGTWIDRDPDQASPYDESRIVCE